MMGGGRRIARIGPSVPGGIGLGIPSPCWCRLCSRGGGCHGPGKVLAQSGIGGIDDLEFLFSGRFFRMLIQITIGMPFLDQRLVSCPQFCSATAWFQPQDLVVTVSGWQCLIGHGFQYLRSRCPGVDNAPIVERLPGAPSAGSTGKPCF